MQRGRIFILIGALLAIAAIAVMMLMSGTDRGDEETSVATGEGGPVVEIKPTPTPTPIPNPIVVAKQRIPRGTLLITTTQIGLLEWVSIESWPMGWVADDALRSIDQVQGKIARLDIPRGTILTDDMLTDQAGDLTEMGSEAALLIPPNRVAIAIPVDHISSLGWALRRGDHVDVLVSFLMKGLDEDFQTELPNYAAALVPIDAVETDETILIQGVYGRIEQDPFGQPLNVIPNLSDVQRPRLVSQITVRDAQVLNVGPWLPWNELFHEAQALSATETEDAATEEEGQEVDGADASAEETTATLEFDTSELDELLEFLEKFSRQPVEPLLLIVSPQEALVLKWCIEQQAPMHLVLRSYADRGVRLPDTEPVTLQYMTTMYNIALPPGLPYGIEPAVRTLERSLLTLPENPLILLPPVVQSEDTPPR